MKLDVTLVSSDDRLCGACCEENKRQLQELRKQTAGKALPSGNVHSEQETDRKAIKKLATSEQRLAATAGRRVSTFSRTDRCTDVVAEFAAIAVIDSV